MVVLLILGSSPVQRWVFEEIQKGLSKSGFVLEIESIEFSMLSPKLYLNRVQLKATKKAPVQLPEPLAVDKIKIHFQPLGLIYKQIIIQEVTLFHPKIVIPQAEQFYSRLKSFIESQKGLELKNDGQYTILVKQAGVVDALVDVKATEHELALRSQSLSMYVQHSIGGQRTVSVQSGNIELQRGPLKQVLHRTDIEVDVGEGGLRMNRAFVKGEKLSLDFKGTASSEILDGKPPSWFSGSFDVRVPLDLLDKIPELKGVDLKGVALLKGAGEWESGKFTATGQVGYENLIVEGYTIGNLLSEFSANPDWFILNDAKFEYAGGIVSSPKISVELKDRFAVEGDLNVRDLSLSALLESVREPDVPVRMKVNGEIKARGVLKGPLEIRGDVETSFGGLSVVDDGTVNDPDQEKILDFGDGTLQGVMVFTKERMTFQSNVEVLGGTGSVDGYLGFNGETLIHANLSQASLTQLERISGLRVGGVADIKGDIEVKGGDVKIGGTVALENAEIASILLGRVKGEVYFKSALLSFEKLEIPSIKPILGHGFVDFGKENLHYKFNAAIDRAPIDQIFGIFQKQELSFPVPVEGEAEARVSIEGGHDDRGVEVVASGSARGFKWFDEAWGKSNFIFTYRSDVVEFNKVLLMKKTGGLEIGGHFMKDRARLTLKSQQLRLEDFDYLNEVPLIGLIDGEITLEGDADGFYSSGYGELQLKDLTFRGKPFDDSLIRLRPEAGGIEFLGSIFGDSLRGRYVRSHKASRKDELLIYFNKLDVVPLLAVLMDQDLTTIGSILATGDLSLTGKLLDWRSLTGSGTISDLEVGLRGTPLKSEKPVAISVNQGALSIGKLHLLGVDGEIDADLEYIPGKQLNAGLDGKLDIRYLQIFVPGLVYGEGKASVSARMSGHPERFRLIGNLSLDDARIRISGIDDTFEAVNLQLGLSQDKLNVNRFDAQLNGGKVQVFGAVKIDRFNKFEPDLRIVGSRIGLNFKESLAIKLNGEVKLSGPETPYLMKGNCEVIEAKLSSFDSRKEEAPGVSGKAPIAFDVKCVADDKVFVETEIINAEFKGDFHLLGDTNQIGLLGAAEVSRGDLIFRDTKFNLESGTVRFESSENIKPRFRMSGRSAVKEQKTVAPQEYVVNINAFGTPEQYSIRLSSSPALSEADIISLLVLGVTSSGQDGNYLELGSTLAGQIPLNKKVKEELGVGISFKSQGGQTSTTSVGTASTAGASVPTVQLQKPITEKTTVFYSNSLDNETFRELRVEQILDNNLTVNATAGLGTRASTDTSTADTTRQSYGIDFRFRFEFE